MKKVLSFIFAFLLCLSFCACSSAKNKSGSTTALSLEERLRDEVKEYISENYQLTAGSYISEPVNVDISHVVESKENQWAVLGTYTVKLNKEIMSAKFGIVATYDEVKNTFSFSKEKFDDFK